MTNKKSAIRSQSSRFDVSLEALLEAGAHFGHQSRRWNPRMDEYIWGMQGGVHIFDLAKTAEKLKEACEFLYGQAVSGKRIVMIGTKRQAAEVVKTEAIKAGVGYVTVRWLGGTITNWKQIKSRIDKLVRMKAERDKGEYKKYTKREQVMIDKEIERMERFFGGLAEFSDKPEVLFVVDTHKERVPVREAKSKGVAVVGLVDSNADPDLVDYVIPVNDDAGRSIKLIVEMVGKALAEGMKEFKKKAKMVEKQVAVK